jgi:hypothetical protein
MDYDDRRYYYSKDIHISDWLLSFREDLTKEFLAKHTDFIDGDFEQGVGFKHKTGYNQDSWKMDGIKYFWPEGNINCYPGNVYPKEVLDVFPTACKIATELGDACPVVQYSVIEKNSIIKRHTGPENTESKYIRIHVPLIIPPGDIWFECEGEDIDWSEVWGFNNQFVHAAFNLTDKRRLILLIDVSREFLNLPPASPFDQARFDRELRKPYVKKFPHWGIQRTYTLDESWNVVVTEEPLGD